ncbi:hypothetical protein DF268_32470 [Streptomyces sp. V2]|uniref:Uncharacterized protein n=1 Tax=Streptomyces niveiscabiei TaxID=164115 RepID=A0ABW9I709_9ACTN|nr:MULTISPECIES: hypothetical protein [Streptomyces]PWG09433.1 hypothetical protein DF268_32470 [Streptomyces sp. V2]
MPNGTSDKPEQPSPWEPFIKPEIIGDCDDCKPYVDEWFKRMATKTQDGAPNENRDPSAASDAAVLWKRHVAEAHSEVTP